MPPGPYALPVYVRRPRTSLRHAVPTAYRGITGRPKPHGHHPPLRGSRGVRDLEERARIGLRTKPGREHRRVHLHDPLVLPYSKICATLGDRLAKVVNIHVKIKPTRATERGQRLNGAAAGPRPPPPGPPPDTRRRRCPHTVRALRTVCDDDTEFWVSHISVRAVTQDTAERSCAHTQVSTGYPTASCPCAHHHHAPGGSGQVLAKGCKKKSAHTLQVPALRLPPLALLALLPLLRAPLPPAQG